MVTHLTYEEEIFRNNCSCWNPECATLSWNGGPSLMKIDISNCINLKSWVYLSNSCFFCSDIQNFQYFLLNCLKSLTTICEEDIDLAQSLSPRGVLFHLKKFCIREFHKIETLLTPGLVPLLENLELLFDEGDICSA